MNSKIAASITILTLLSVVIFALLTRWDSSENVAQGQADSPAAEATDPPEGATPSPQQPAAWQRPRTTDPREYVIAFGKAIWTYDSTIHSLYEWQDAVTAFANPLESPEGGRLARGLLPITGQWDELKVHRASASVRNVRAESTPELKALERDPRAPSGWHGYVVRATQDRVVSGETTVAERQVTVGVICRPRCTFWSATAESPR